MKTQSSKYSIPAHWDVDGDITPNSSPRDEFNLWYEFALQSPDWTGNEFTLSDFENYIQSL